MGWMDARKISVRIEDRCVRMDEKKCHQCDGVMNSWDERLTKTFKVKNTCEKCFCKVYDLNKEEFRKTMENFYDIRPCQGI